MRGLPNPQAKDYRLRLTLRSLIAYLSTLGCIPKDNPPNVPGEIVNE